jgi:hypothetical protein
MQYNTGRSWHLDHARHNKREDYEIPMNRRKGKYGDGRKYAGGGFTGGDDDEPKVVRTIFEEEEFDYEGGGMMAKGGGVKMPTPIQLVLKGKKTDIKGFNFKVYEFDGVKYALMTPIKGNQYVEKYRGMADGGMMKRGGKLMDKANYIPNRMIQAVEVERKGKTTEIDGADVFDGIYVKKRVKYGMGGGISAMSKLDKKFQALGWRDTTEAYYGLDFTPFMSVVEQLIEEVSK